MAITVIDSPALVQPVYNPIYTKVSSDQTSQEAFNFLFDTYVNGSLVNRDRLLPRPGTTQAIYSPARVLESYLSFDLTQNIVGDVANANCIDQYEIIVGEEFVKYWLYFTIGEDSVTSTSYTMVSSIPGIPHNYSVNDYINITQNSGYTYSKYNGVHKVKAIIDDFSILIDINWTDANPSLSEPGKSTWADKRKTVYITDEIILEDGTDYSQLANWDYYGPDGCGVECGIFPDNSLTLVVPDVSCGTALQVLNYNTISLIPGRVYRLTYTITANDPSGEGWNIYSDINGNSVVHNTPGTKVDIITAGPFGPFAPDISFGFDLRNADTGGFGSHSLKITDLLVELLPISITGYDFNGVLQYEEVPSWDYLDYIMDPVTPSTNPKFLTKQPQTILTKLNERGSISFLNVIDFYPANEYYINISVTNNSGGVSGYNYELSATMEQSPDITNRFIHFGAHPWNINQFSTIQGDGNIIDVNTRSYSLTLLVTNGSFTNEPISETKTFELDQTCSRFDPVRFMFLNSLGGFDYYTATLLSRTTINTTKDYFVKTLGSGYVVGDRGKTAINTNAQESYTVNTDWISEDTARWLSYELYNSIEIYVLDTEGVIIPVVLDVSSIEVKKRVNDKLLNYTFNYSKAVPLNNQRN